MCIISDKIKFCTCKATSTDRLQHYWKLYRRNKDKNELIIGMMLFSDEFIKPNYELNYDTLVNRINEEDAFDFDTSFKNKDILEIVFYNNDDLKRMVYGFEFSKENWKKEVFSELYVMGFCDALKFGKIKKM